MPCLASLGCDANYLTLGLGVKLFAGFFDHFEEVDAEFI